jgi:hypothetical protein
VTSTVRNLGFFGAQQFAKIVGEFPVSYRRKQPGVSFEDCKLSMHFFYLQDFCFLYCKMFFMRVWTFQVRFFEARSPNNRTVVSKKRETNGGHLVLGFRRSHADAFRHKSAPQVFHIHKSPGAKKKKTSRSSHEKTEPLGCSILA